jgi:hypothetical protein
MEDNQPVVDCGKMPLEEILTAEDLKDPKVRAAWDRVFVDTIKARNTIPPDCNWGKSTSE